MKVSPWGDPGGFFLVWIGDRMAVLPPLDWQRKGVS